MLCMVLLDLRKYPKYWDFMKSLILGVSKFQSTCKSTARRVM